MSIAERKWSDGFVHHHPLDDDRTFVTTNGDRLLPFVHKPNVEATLAYATAFYDEKGTVSGAVDAELLEDGQEVPLTKEKSYVGDDASLFAAKPFEAVPDWTQEPLRKLGDANAKMRLGVCTLPS